MKKIFSFIALFLTVSIALFAQVAVNTDGSTPDNSAMLEVKSTTKGTLLSRMTQAQIATISSPANGLIVFCTTDNKFYTFIESANTWKELLYGSGTIAPTCGSSFTINHVTSGNVAPVNKTVTYGTVTNVPGEPSKCWITRNLGASQQATAVSDESEVSAGWYWQFNRKQGFKHDGTTLTPNIAWVPSIVESSDWIPANDPCALELGGSWRLPTSTEWINVFAAGNWTNWTGPWNSVLKLHASGNLSNSGGLLGLRGTMGFYWGSTQYSNSNGWYLYFYSDYSYVINDSKAFGFSVRCLKNN